MTIISLASLRISLQQLSSILINLLISHKLLVIGLLVDVLLNKKNKVLIEPIMGNTW